MSEETKAATTPSTSVPGVKHNDNEKSAIPDRKDDGREAAPNDPPGQGEDAEPPVG